MLKEVKSDMGSPVQSQQLCTETAFANEGEKREDTEPAAGSHCLEQDSGLQQFQGKDGAQGMVKYAYWEINKWQMIHMKES